MILTMVRCLLSDSGLEDMYWGEAIHMATLLYNRIPCDNGKQSLYEAWHGKPPRMDHLQQVQLAVQQQHLLPCALPTRPQANHRTVAV